MKKSDNEYLKTSGYSPSILDVIEAINKAHRSNNFICVTLLSRKLLETLIIDILMKNPGPSVVWKDATAGHRNTLHSLLETFWNLMESEFKLFTPQYDSSALTVLRNASWILKKSGDQGAHTLMIDTSSIEEIRADFQKLIDFLNDMKNKIPDAKIFRIDMDQETASSGIRFNISHPRALPNIIETNIYGRNYRFEISFGVEPAKENIDCEIYVVSKTQAVIIIWDHVREVKKWFGFRKKQMDCALDYSISDRIECSKTTAFKFDAEFRPFHLIEGKDDITIEYHIKGKGVKSGRNYDLGKRRIVIPVGLLKYIKNSPEFLKDNPKLVESLKRILSRYS